MRRLDVLALFGLLALFACGHPPARAAAVSSPALPPSALPRLLPSLPGDPAARGAPYLDRVALQLQPGWGQFLDDCRLRLPKAHLLNNMQLAATAELAIDKTGRVDKVELATSGNADYDEAVRDAISDASPLAAPPPELLSDDDHVHLRWLFARDRRQAGPATASVFDVTLPLDVVMPRWFEQGDVTRAAERLARAPANDAGRAHWIDQLMDVVFAQALGSADGATRRAAVSAVAQAHRGALAAQLRTLLARTSDTELRLVTIDAAVTLADREAVAALLAALPDDLSDYPRVASAEARALVALGHAADAAAILEHALASPELHALRALAYAPAPALETKLATWLRAGDARTRAGVCTALQGMGAWPLVAQGLRDADATVRTACVDAARARARDPKAITVVPRLHALVRDRDRTVRAHALSALVALDPAHLVSAVDDPSGEVRAAFATALATALPSEAETDLRTLIDDRDADVRAAAWSSLSHLPAAPADRAALALHAIRDTAPQVRLAAVPAVDDDSVLAQLAAADDSPDVRTASIVQLAARRGRAAVEGDLLGRLAAAPPGSAERVRIALAWLLAR